jgi:hypothetical protein
VEHKIRGTHSCDDIMNEVSDDLGNKDDEGTHETTATLLTPAHAG